jgi:predicted nucleotidyltransferase
MRIDGKPIEAYRFFQDIVALPCVEAIYLIGSRARGDHNERSDIDLAVSCPLASDAEWEHVRTLARSNNETLLRVDPVRLENITAPGFRDFVLHKRQLLYLKTFGGHTIVEERESALFDVLSEKLDGWIAALPSPQDTGTDAGRRQLLDCFHGGFECLWGITRKAIAIHGMHTNTPLSTFREAYMEGWLDNRLLWEAMIEDYHLTRKPPEPGMFEQLQARLPGYLREMRAAADHVISIIKPYLHAAVIA